jgi:hypothetical protein
VFAGVRANDDTGPRGSKSLCDPPLIGLISARWWHRRRTDADWRAGGRRLIAIRTHERCLQRLRQDDRAFQRRHVRLDLIGGLVADEEGRRLDHAGRRGRPALGITNERHVARRGHLDRQARELPAPPELERIEARVL